MLKPGTAAISAAVAARNRATEPTAASSAFARFGPTPGMPSSALVSVALPRRFRCSVIAKRCASSRSAASIRTTGPFCGGTTGFTRFGRKNRSGVRAALLSPP